ncbi:SpaH/EbpB family LPXTG-anchored major pilin [Jeotgalibaca sp. MA1X17-3]|uniref:SpaH/EbpB family LPXTG-anchored major pilin n=1 Tax=Jeotgalibaca sp. MA1X17-3 TaxID=2908211 RepID=UPI001F335764|nr:SpaH/EbpB family LPXTG-anchored major pilin [Jeotgalibaca sp. MA1X17-3]UJF16296.1 SpaH/EbpB family LPXTG-anchored major pilin [Jeotgalibaca sp. MA1X17-3]
MNNKRLLRWMTTLLIAVMTVLGLVGQTVAHATETAPAGPLTDVIITKVDTPDQVKDMTLEQLRDGVDVGFYFTNGKVLPGVSFTYFSVTAQQLMDMKANPGAFDTAAEVAAEVGNNGTATAETDSNGQVTLPNLPEGNYWIVENTKGTIVSSRAVPFGLTLPFTNTDGNGYLENIYVYPKNTLEDLPDLPEKTVYESNVAIGQLNTWTISMNIPEGIEDYDKFTFIDEIDSRLDFEGTQFVFVTATGAGLVEGEDYIISFNDAAGQVGNYGPLDGKTLTGTLTVEFTEAGRKKLANVDPKKVEIKFNTKVNKTAIMGQDIFNNVVIDFDNGNGDTGEYEPTTPPYVNTGGKAFLKKDGSTDAALNGAEFKITNAQGQYVILGDEGAITFGTEADATVFTSDADGKFEVRGLPYATYTLVETKAPAGYALPTNPETTFEIDAGSYYTNATEVTMWDTESNNPQMIVNKKVTIPQTGGIGTMAFTLIGAALILFSIVFYKRSSKA